jgi:hypothetical protein
MGHIGVKGLGRTVRGLQYSDKTSPTCEICARANIKRTPFPMKSLSKASRILYRIHSDICGPLPIGYGQFRYFILFIDEWSCYVFIFLMKKHSEAVTHFKHFKQVAERMHGEKICFFRVDNAPEFVEGELRKFCEEEGIQYEQMVPESPQQNGKSERHNYTFERMIRAMLLDANLHDYFWIFAALVAVHIKNRVPHSALPPDITPFERWLKHKPSIAHLRPFGAYCTSRLVNPDNLTKFEPRGEHGRFLGYAADAKGYLFWHTESRSVKVRRDLTFHNPPKPTLGHGRVDYSAYTPLWNNQDVTEIHDEGVQDITPK